MKFAKYVKITYLTTLRFQQYNDLNVSFIKNGPVPSHRSFSERGVQLTELTYYLLIENYIGTHLLNLVWAQIIVPTYRCIQINDYL